MTPLKIKKGLLAGAVFACSLYTMCAAQTGGSAQRFAQSISVPDLRRHLMVLTHDSLKGRGLGDCGDKAAARYIIDAFRHLELSPVSEDCYTQSFQLYRQYWDDVYLIANGKKYRHPEEVVYVGNKEIPEEKSYKLKLISEADTAAGDQAGAFFNTPYWTNLRRTGAYERMPLALIDRHHADNFQDYAARLHEEPVFRLPQDLESDGGNNLFMMIVSGANASEIFNIREKKLTKIGDGRLSRRKLPQADITIKATKKADTIWAENALGFIEGYKTPEEVIVISAHYDHLGLVDGKIYYGADDNGSGVAALLEIAEAFSLASKSGFRPERSILFAAFSGEETNLSGSRYYMENPLFPLSSTVVNLNIDMIGRVDERHRDDPEYIYLIGTDGISPALRDLSEETNNLHTKLKLDYCYDSPDDPNQFYCRSDHYSFAQKQIPAIFYFSGIHEDYHKPSDTIDKIEFDVMKKRTELIFYTAWRLANGEREKDMKTETTTH